MACPVQNQMSNHRSTVCHEVGSHGPPKFLIMWSQRFKQAPWRPTTVFIPCSNSSSVASRSSSNGQNQECNIHPQPSPTTSPRCRSPKNCSNIAIACRPRRLLPEISPVRRHPAYTVRLTRWSMLNPAAFRNSAVHRALPCIRWQRW